MKTTILSFFICCVFALYWGINVFMNLPDNFMKIHFLEYEKMFSKVFQQRWSLFAPPPKSNDRLYYVFVEDSASTEKAVYEVLSIINQTKRSKYPFGENESVLEYILSNNASSLVDFLRENYKYYQQTNCKGLSEDECTRNFYEKDVWAYIEKTDEVRTLVNYGKIVALRNGVSKNKKKMRFIITYKNIKPFSMRDSAMETTEDIVYQSPLLSY